ncbi:MAG TPA: hypothetical protein VK778_05555 [Solirubrobacteraceae bacterium]|jgi:hypothetical protein|nr:hypothetical protein [Solirubrobacteraceae bacterium]
MSQNISESTSRRRRIPVVATALLAVLAGVVLAACGGSSSSTSSTASTSTSASTSTAGKAAGAPGSRFAALRECLQKNGITLPARKPGKRPSGGAGGFLGGGGGGFTLPKGVTRAQYEAAIKKCGGVAGGGRFAGGAGGASIFSSPAAKAALAKFAACMREDGVNVPAPNTSGKGPVFDTKGLDTSSAAFKTAESKCSSDLRGAFRARPGAAGGPPGGPAGAGAGGAASKSAPSTAG